MLLSCLTSTTHRTGHSPNGQGPGSIITVPLALGVGTITRTCVTVCGGSVADPTARITRVSSVTALALVTERMVHGRRSPMCSFSFQRDPGTQALVPPLSTRAAPSTWFLPTTPLPPIPCSQNGHPGSRIDQEANPVPLDPSREL